MGSQKKPEMFTMMDNASVSVNIVAFLVSKASPVIEVDVDAANSFGKNRFGSDGLSISNRIDIDQYIRILISPLP